MRKLRFSSCPRTKVRRHGPPGSARAQPDIVFILLYYYVIRVGLTLMVLGEIGNFSAYGFSPASLVAPLGTTTVIGMLCFSCLSLITKINEEEKSLRLVTFAPR